MSWTVTTNGLSVGGGMKFGAKSTSNGVSHSTRGTWSREAIGENSRAGNLDACSAKLGLAASGKNRR